MPHFTLNAVFASLLKRFFIIRFHEDNSSMYDHPASILGCILQYPLTFNSNKSTSFSS